MLGLVKRRLCRTLIRDGCSGAADAPASSQRCVACVQALCRRLCPPVMHDLCATMYAHRHSHLIWCYPGSDEIPVRTGERKDS